MPSIQIDYSQIATQLSSPPTDEPSLISTPDGLALLEIQGTLNLPTKISEDHEYITVDSIQQLIKVGRLELDGDKLTLYIGVSQRLLGKLEKIDPPFGLLRFPEKMPDNENTLENLKVEMVNIIDRKLVFKNRPLPIM